MSDQVEAMRLVHDGDVLPYGSERIRVHSEAVRVADMHQDLELGFSTRQALITSATMGGEPNLALIGFSWCLSQYDANPDRFSRAQVGAHGLLWKYKWIVERVSEHPAISRSKVADLLADMAKRFAAQGHGMRSVRKLELWSAMNMLDQERVSDALKEWLKIPRDLLSDCVACDADCQAAAYLAMNDLDGARRAAVPLFQGRLTCAEVPTITYGRFLLPLSQAGQEEEARRLARLLPRRIGTNRDFVGAAGALVLHLVGLGSRDSLRSASRYASWALAGETPLRRLILMIALVRASQLACDVGEGDRPLGAMLPNETPISYAAARERLTREARELSEAFDRRNGHGRVGQAVKEHLSGEGRWWWPL